MPWLLRLVASPTGRWALAAIFHDFLYKTWYLSRLESDQMFYKIMRDSGVHELKATSAYYLVRWFGWYRYNKYGKNIEKYRKYGYVESITR